jgi:hypothetical protein
MRLSTRARRAAGSRRLRVVRARVRLPRACGRRLWRRARDRQRRLRVARRWNTKAMHSFELRDAAPDGRRRRQREDDGYDDRVHFLGAASTCSESRDERYPVTEEEATASMGAHCIYTHAETDLTRHTHHDCTAGTHDRYRHTSLATDATRRPHRGCAALPLQQHTGWSWRVRACARGRRRR